MPTNAVKIPSRIMPFVWKGSFMFFTAIKIIAANKIKRTIINGPPVRSD
jgi:hypothetical protein